MEAASARAAARDRFSDFGRSSPSQLQRFIQSACSAQNHEPNLALCLEITDLINTKKGTAPREAAIAIVNYVNHRDSVVAELALDLLDMCVKNCGYPFHLQISTKEFLNELVRRFPERPPIRPSRVQSKILQAIEEWRRTICETSKYKQDFGYIRDMHRLLSYKGYSFPELRPQDAAVLNTSSNLKSAEEMEAEEHEAQSAKLQELIRRGTPADLQEANRLMKVMTGYDTRTKTDYRAKAAEDVAKIQAKARLLEERLEAFNPADTADLESLAAALQSAQPKIQKMCEEESDDHEAVARLLEINDSIHRTAERYRLIKKGDVEGAAKIARGAPVSAAGSSSKAPELSLIDFDADAAEATKNGGSTSAGPSQPGGLEDDLLGLNLGDPIPTSYGQAGDIALGFGGNHSAAGPSLLSSTTQNNYPKSPSPGFSSFSSAPLSSPTPPQVAQQSRFTPPQPQSQPAADPFASLINVSSPSSSVTPTPPNATTAPAAPAASNDDDEWAFASALPPEAPKEYSSVVCNTGLTIKLHASRQLGPNAITLQFQFLNNTSEQFTELHHQLAAQKGYELQLSPQSGRTLEPNGASNITQRVAAWQAGSRDKKVESIKLRWRVSYKVNGVEKNETGEIPEFTLA
ncbi:related to Arf-binding protein [Cephalotrichum gorgonifer]|uniref:Related to Arf-binding protein n=1 Tax=Cephalotrichum gorgonifer TaxID=2041049 RepID=A0AAE8MXZ7_9PEZI|nr:related to Arf-binding protein [Cephalotrichum gorgonifer]